MGTGYYKQEPIRAQSEINRWFTWKDRLFIRRGNSCRTKKCRNKFLDAAYDQDLLRKQQESINVIAANKLGRVHNLLEAEGHTGHQLELLMVRILFCLFAEDTGILKDRSFTREILDHQRR